MLTFDGALALLGAVHETRHEVIGTEHLSTFDGERLLRSGEQRREHAFCMRV